MAVPALSRTVALAANAMPQVCLESFGSSVDEYVSY